jgi:iron complex transport system substrate-binding protein
MQSILVGLAGGDPVWFGANPGEGWGRVGFEQIAAWNPDVLIVIDYHETVDATVAALRKDARFAALACGKGGKILGFPQDWYSWDQPDTRWGLGLLWLAKALRPAEFARLDLAAEAREFYRLFYGFDAASFDRMVMPRLKGDYALTR